MKPSIIICNGMIRSGSTLAYNLIREYVELLSLGKGAGFLEKENAIIASNKIQESSDMLVIKTHDVFGIEKKTDITYVYTYRDLRDVAISLKKKIPKNDKLIISMIDESIKQYNNTKNLNNCIKIRYEKLVEDEEAALRALCTKLSLPIIENTITSAVSNNTIESVLEKSKQRSIKDKILIKLRNLGIGRIQIYDKTTLLHHNHISDNKGKTTSWKESSHKSLILDIEREHMSWLKENSYE